MSKKHFVLVGRFVAALTSRAKIAFRQNCFKHFLSDYNFRGQFTQGPFSAIWQGYVMWIVNLYPFKGNNFNRLPKFAFLYRTGINKFCCKSRLV